jgi:hypothetical protein
LFQYPTVGSLARFLSERGETSLENIRDRGRKKQAAFARRQKPKDKVPA